MFTHLGSSAAVVSTEAGESDTEDVPPAADTTLTPPKQVEAQCGSIENKVSGQQSEQGEARCGSIENKVSGQQSDVDVRLQLQADMVLTCTTLVKQTLKAVTTAAEIKIVNAFSCYGVLIGPTYSLKLLKLSIDF